MRLLLAIAVLFAAAPVSALELSPAARATLEQGQPFVEVRTDPKGGSGVIRAAIDIAAPQAVVWAVMTDCALAPKMAANLKSCRILERDPAGRWDVREQISRPMLLPSVRSVFRQEFDPPRRAAFHRIGGDLEVYEGEWRLASVGDNVRVTYEVRIAAPMAVPAWAARMALRREVPAALLALRRESEARAQTRESIARAE